MSQDSLTADFLDRTEELYQRGETTIALDGLCDYIDDSLLAGKFAEVDELLASTICDKYSYTILLLMAMMTLPAKNRLGSRADFFQRVVQVVRSRGDDPDDLLQGFE